MGDPTGAAHLTGTLQTAPSLFELLSVENFSSALRSAILHVVKFVSSRNPERYGVLYRNFDELFLVLDGILQLQYLKTKRATLAEAFYGLERLHKWKDGKVNIVSSVLTSVLITYGSSKAKALYDSLREENSRVEWKTTYVKFYPIFKAVLGTLKLIKYIQYSLGRSVSHDYILDMLGLRVGYASMDQLQPTPNKTTLKWVLFTMGESILWVIEIGSFFVQFLDAYTNKRGSLSSSLPTPEFYHVNAGANLDKFKCPICNERRKNPAALSTSGVTFCYSCIAKYLQHYARCPVTNIPSNPDHIIRLFYT